MKEISVKNI